MPRKAKEKDDELNTVQSENKPRNSSSKSKDAKIASKTATRAKTNKKETKATTTKTTKKTKKATSSKTTKKATSKALSPVVEYYDLPFRYNQTVVKILAQTPNTLFIYWDISDEDKKAYTKKYGENFFYSTKPVLMITNETMNYTFEVEINDFANSWYLHIGDANCQYKVELGRKPIVLSNAEVPSSTSNHYIGIVSSNKIEAPNDHILFDNLGKTVFFRNTKTNITESRTISSISYLNNIGRIQDIYDLYKEIYHDELILDELGVNLPSSSNSSSFK